MPSGDETSKKNSPAKSFYYSMDNIFLHWVLFMVKNKEDLL
tara:strand:- start:3877 stop:3999 length:123 start_codon:yes stop_codon:yes gene_type:complete